MNNDAPATNLERLSKINDRHNVWLREGLKNLKQAEAVFNKGETEGVLFGVKRAIDALFQFAIHDAGHSLNGPYSLHELAEIINSISNDQVFSSKQIDCLREINQIGLLAVGASSSSASSVTPRTYDQTKEAIQIAHEVIQTIEGLYSKNKPAAEELNTQDDERIGLS